MNSFLIIAGLMAAASWWLVARPLLRRTPPGARPVDSLKQQLLQLEQLHDAGTLSDDAYAHSRAGLERRIVEAVTADAPDGAAAPARPRALLAGLAVFIVIVAAGGYRLVGTPAALDAPAAAMAARTQDAGGEGAAPGARHELSFEQIAALAEKLANRLKERPNDAEGWSMLARSYVVLGRYPEAVEAYKRTVALVQDDAQLYADYADALAMASNRSLEGEPMKLVARALAIDAANLKALSLAGTHAFDNKDYANAVRYWEKAAQAAGPGSEFFQQVQSGIAEARDLATKAGIKLAPPAAAVAGQPGGAAPAAAAIGGVSGRVSLAAGLAQRAAPEDTVFVFARAAQGPRMPLAIVRRQVKDLPFDFALDDTTAMSPEMRLSRFPQVVVGARVSKSGDAMPQVGDLQGLSATVALGTTGLKIEIADVVK